MIPNVFAAAATAVCGGSSPRRVAAAALVASPAAFRRAARTLAPVRSSTKAEPVAHLGSKSQGVGSCTPEERARLQELQAKALGEAMRYIDMHADISNRYFLALMQYYAGTADLSDELTRTIAYRHFVTRRRPYIIRVADGRQVFADLFPRDLRNIKAEIFLKAAFENRPLELDEKVAPSDLAVAPEVAFRVFHPDTRLYTCLMLDADKVHPAGPDAEDGAEQRELILRAVVDIPLSTGTGDSGCAYQALSRGRELIPFLPVHPTKGTGKHRVVTLLLEQPENKSGCWLWKDDGNNNNNHYNNNNNNNNNNNDDNNDNNDDDKRKLPKLPLRLSRDHRIWPLVNENKLIPRGVHVLQSEWDESVPAIFKDVLGQHEPVYVRRPDEAAQKSKARNVYRPIK